MRYYLWITVSLCMLVAALQGLASAQAVPDSINYQGRLTDSTGKPVANGAYSLVFKLYSAESGTTAPLWTSSAISVTTTNGLFSAQIAPPSSVFGTSSLWLETVVGGTTLSPRVKLTSAPFAVRAASAALADAVPDKSITTSKLAFSLNYAEASYVTGVNSGMPSTQKLNFYIGGVALNPQPVLSEPYKETIEVIEYQDAEDRVLRLRPGRIKSGSLVLRRKFTSDRTLYNWYRSVADGAVARQTVEMVLVDGTAEKARWAFLHAWPSHYQILLADDGFPVEQIAIVSDGTATRTISATRAGRPMGTGEKRNIDSNQVAPIGTTYQLSATGLSYPEDIAIASDIGAQTEVVEYTNTDGITILKRPGRTRIDRLLVRQTPLSRSTLYPWYSSVVSGRVERRDVSLMFCMPRFSTQEAGVLRGAWPCSYTLRLVDDNQLVEEMEIAGEEFTHSQ